MPRPSDPITVLPFIGPAIAKKFKNLEITTIKDLLYHFPSRYEDTRKITPIDKLVLANDKKYVVKAQVVELKSVYIRGGMAIVTAKLKDKSGEIRASWFNQIYIKNALKKGRTYLFYGKLKKKKSELSSPDFEELRAVSYIGKNTKPTTSKESKKRGSTLELSPPLEKFQTPTHFLRFTPVYPETKGISSKRIRTMMRSAKDAISEIDDWLPAEKKIENNFLDLRESLQKIHFPQSQEEIEAARDRLAFEELFQILRALHTQQKAEEKGRGPDSAVAIKKNNQTLNEFKDNLPFTLTKAQKKAISEIFEDINTPKPSNRILVGDVGSGKTAVAAAIIKNVLDGWNSAPEVDGTGVRRHFRGSAVILTATTVLARQHFETFKKFLPGYDIRLVVGKGAGTGNEEEPGASASKTSKKAWYNGIGEVNLNEDEAPQIETPYSAESKLTQRPAKSDEDRPQLWIGTHAILHKEKIPENTALIVIDEQHKFGVKQRRHEHFRGIHRLTMTATPIPRSMALLFYGEKEVSYLNEMPKGRKPPKTLMVPPKKKKEVYRWIHKEITDYNNQAYYIAPLIEESEKLNTASVEKVYKELQTGILGKIPTGIVHGSLKEEEKQKTLNAFAKGEIKILVATSVIEVGIDIPQANIMVIEGADRFGLAQLHQLRGRIGRGTKQSHCFIQTTGKESKEVKDRLKFFTKNTDGLEIAIYDLKRRGPGEVYGLKQAGIPRFRLADPLDIRQIERARKILSEVYMSKKSEPCPASYLNPDSKSKKGNRI